jgi:hypothetical protein
MINFILRTKDEERYWFLYDDEHVSDMFKCLARYASNPDLSFTWYDAAIVSQAVRNLRSESIRYGY